MRDGSTRVKKRSGRPTVDDYLSANEVKLVAISGPEAGRELPLSCGRVTIGRGPGVDMAFDDPDMSRQHAAIDCSEQGFRIHDLRSTNGILVDDESVQSGPLAHGSLIELGGHVLQLVIEEREEEPRVYELSVDS